MTVKQKLQEREPMPYYPAYPSLAIWEMTFKEHSRRLRGQKPKDADKMLGVEQDWWLFIPDGQGKYALDCLWDVIEPGSKEDLRFYQMCLRKAFLWGYLTWELRLGTIGHNRMRNIFISAAMRYPRILNKVKEFTEVEYHEYKNDVRPTQWVRSLT